MELFSQQAEQMNDKGLTVCAVVDDKIRDADHVRRRSRLWAKRMAERTSTVKELVRWPGSLKDGRSEALSSIT